MAKAAKRNTRKGTRPTAPEKPSPAVLHQFYGWTMEARSKLHALENRLAVAQLACAGVDDSEGLAICFELNHLRNELTEIAFSLGPTAPDAS